jgi:hypothetical protein
MNVVLITDIFARSGGGGSSSGSGGGGGVVILLGYLPMHFVGAKLKKHMPLAVASLITWPAALVYGVALTFALRTYGFFIAIAALIGAGAGLYDWFNKIAKLGKKAKKDLAVAAASDSSWDEEALKTHAQNIFIQYQQDWSANQIEPAQRYMTPWYFYHATLMVAAMKQAGRQNVVSNPQIQSIQLVRIDDVANKEGDSFTVAITAKADDQLYESSTQTLLFRDQKSFTEYWQFVRTNGVWLLSGIQQATANAAAVNDSLRQFAAAQRFCYSADWGWLLLPKRGQLFHKANFGRSDINNHVIGVYNNVLVQIYNYVPVKTAKEATANYLIAQASVPKSYGTILVRKKRKFGLFSNPKGLTKLSTEWGEFNNKYEIWASDLERVTSFELLHPAFMVKLQELPFEVNIEVVDTTVYLYTHKAELTTENYTVMLTILQEAFKQMRM